MSWPTLAVGAMAILECLQENISKTQSSAGLFHSCSQLDSLGKWSAVKAEVEWNIFSPKMRRKDCLETIKRTIFATVKSFLCLYMRDYVVGINLTTLYTMYVEVCANKTILVAVLHLVLTTIFRGKCSHKHGPSCVRMYTCVMFAASNNNNNKYKSKKALRF